MPHTGSLARARAVVYRHLLCQHMVRLLYDQLGNPSPLSPQKLLLLPSCLTRSPGTIHYGFARDDWTPYIKPT